MEASKLESVRSALDAYAKSWADPGPCSEANSTYWGVRRQYPKYFGVEPLPRRAGWEMGQVPG